MNKGRTLRDEGITQVLEVTDDAYKKEFWRVVKYYVARDIPFWSERVSKCMKVAPARPNSLPALMSHAVKRYDLIEVRHVQATRPEARGHKLPVWRSRENLLKAGLLND